MKFSQWISLIVLLVCLYISWQIRSILLLTLMAIVFAVILNRAVIFLRHWFPSRPWAVAVLVGLLFITFGVFGAIVFPPFIKQLQELINLIPQVANRIQLFVISVEDNLPETVRDSQMFQTVVSQMGNFNVEMLFGRFFTLFSNTLSTTLNLLLGIVVTIMLLLNPRAYRNLFIKVFPASLRQQVDIVLVNCERVLAGWFVGIIFNMLVIAIFSTVGLWLLGVPLALGNGLLAGLLAFIPNIGPVLSVIPPTAIAFLEGPWKALSVVILYIFIQQVESNILTPIVMRKQVSLLPAVTLLCQVTFAVFFGFLGLLLALPLTLISQQWLEEFWINKYAEQH